MKDTNSTAKSSAEQKQLRLFGFQLYPSDADDRSNNSSSSSSTATEKSSAAADGTVKKLECQYCNKVFSNSQALGGHQNAHKKERMRKKRLQLQARSRPIFNHYIHPLIDKNRPSSFNYYSTYNPQTWCAYSPPEFCIGDEEAGAAGIDFGRYGGGSEMKEPDASRWYGDLQTDHGGRCEEDAERFSVTCLSRPASCKPTSSSSSSRNPKTPYGRDRLDLELGLGFEY